MYDIKFPSKIDKQRSDLLYKLLPKRAKIPDNEKHGYESYNLENYSQSLWKNI